MEFHGGDSDFGVDCAGLHVFGRTDFGDLQRGAAVFPDRDGIYSARLSRTAGRGRLGWPESENRERRDGAFVEVHGTFERESDGRGVVRDADGAGVRAVVRILV